MMKLADNSVLYERKEQEPREQYVLQFLNRQRCWEGRRIYVGWNPLPGRIEWTDGRSYIAVARWYLALDLATAAGAAALVTTLYHGLAHDRVSCTELQHGISFYRRYHDLTQDDDGNGSSSLGLIVALVDAMLSFEDKPIRHRKRL